MTSVDALLLPSGVFTHAFPPCAPFGYAIMLGRKRVNCVLNHHDARQDDRRVRGHEADMRLGRLGRNGGNVGTSARTRPRDGGGGSRGGVT